MVQYKNAQNTKESTLQMQNSSPTEFTRKFTTSCSWLHKTTFKYTRKKHKHFFLKTGQAINPLFIHTAKEIWLKSTPLPKPNKSHISHKGQSMFQLTKICYYNPQFLFEKLFFSISSPVFIFWAYWLGVLERYTYTIDSVLVWIDFGEKSCRWKWNRVFHGLLH
jgi:hypothetical protein